MVIVTLLDTMGWLLFLFRRLESSGVLILDYFALVELSLATIHVFIYYCFTIDL